MRGNTAKVATTPSAAMPKIKRGRASTTPSVGRYTAFSRRTNQLSFSPRMIGALGSRNEQRTGVTVTATTSDAKMLTT